MSTRSLHAAASEYRMGAVWATAVFLLLLVVMAWFAGGYAPIERSKLAVFLLWLHVVPLGALLINRLT